jgi:hypothetical protein
MLQHYDNHNTSELFERSDVVGFQTDVCEMKNTVKSEDIFSPEEKCHNSKMQFMSSVQE